MSAPEKWLTNYVSYCSGADVRRNILKRRLKLSCLKISNINFTLFYAVFLKISRKILKVVLKTTPRPWESQNRPVDWSTLKNIVFHNQRPIRVAEKTSHVKLTLRWQNWNLQMGSLQWPRRKRLINRLTTKNEAALWLLLHVKLNPWMRKISPVSTRHEYHLYHLMVLKMGSELKNGAKGNQKCTLKKPSRTTLTYQRLKM